MTNLICNPIRTWSCVLKTKLHAFLLWRFRDSFIGWHANIWQVAQVIPTVCINLCSLFRVRLCFFNFLFLFHLEYQFIFFAFNFKIFLRISCKNFFTSFPSPSPLPNFFCAPSFSRTYDLFLKYCYNISLSITCLSSSWRSFIDNPNSIHETA